MKKLFQTIYTLYAWITLGILWAAGYFILIFSTLGVKDKESRYNALERKLTRIAFRLMGVRIDTQGVENIPVDEPVIFVSNHQSFFDIKLSLAAIPRNISFISKDILFKIPFLGKYMRVSGHIGIRRSNERAAYEALSKVVNKLKGGKSVVFFPEGTRSENGELGPFKRGVSMVVLRSGRKVVPTAIIGSGHFLAKNSFLCNPQKRNVCFRFGKPLEFSTGEKEDRSLSREVVTKIRDEVSKLLYN
ncbi:MAG: 1-acyl-sn-glycerol-3-phosphate acyltransferase [Candidatus Scalindua sp.]|nr:1-acyl-sn-glycerol-3-phosphate acyltransferase [Candidatus Scalindua sp.]